MLPLLPIATTADEADRAATIAVLPVGSFEQHGSHLPLATDTMIACVLATEIARRYDLLLLPPITVACSHEHVGWVGTVSISSATLHAVIADIAASLENGGIRRILIVNAHGGNYVLSNIVQEASIVEPRMALFPGRDDWRSIREAVGCDETDPYRDMHAGELETSILLYALPEVVRSSFRDTDHDANHRPHLLSLGMRGYTPSGVIGRPSTATADKGKAIIEGLVDLARPFVEILAPVKDPG
ncbi:MAG TPA: creatininase family protein [Kineosporiaceae bacterium]